MKNSFVSLGGLSPIQKQGAEVYKELCSIGTDFCVYSSLNTIDVVNVKCYCLDKPFFAWLNRRKLFYSVYGCFEDMVFLVLC